jgi:hypothetical protein
LLSTGGTLEYRNLPSLPPWLVRLLRPLTGFIVRYFRHLQHREVVMTGTTFVYLFDPQTESWEYAGDMVEGRWYPTNTTLPDGRVLIISGSDEGGGFGSTEEKKTNMRVEVYRAGEGLEQVATIPETEAGDGDGQEEHPLPSLYPRMHVLPLSDEEKAHYPAGKVFYSGYGPQTKMLDVRTWEWTDVAKLNFGRRYDGCCVLLPLRPPDYRARVLTFGGRETPGLDVEATETAELIDLGEPSPTWEWAASLQDKRAHACAVLLAEGRVLAVGGMGTGLFDVPVTNVEAFDPVDKTWSLMAPMTVPRGYHSTAILLPDGRVLSAGTTPFQKYELRIQVYSPGYLFRGPRPEIKQAPQSVAYDQAFEVAYKHEGAIDSAVFIRPGAVTHAFDMDQRYVVLEIELREDGCLRVKAPRDSHVAPPGYYMLFLLTGDGVPSEAQFVQLGASQ